MLFLVPPTSSAVKIRPQPLRARPSLRAQPLFARPSLPTQRPLSGFSIHFFSSMPAFTASHGVRAHALPSAGGNNGEGNGRNNGGGGGGDDSEGGGNRDDSDDNRWDALFLLLQEFMKMKSGTADMVAAVEGPQLLCFKMFRESLLANDLFLPKVVAVLCFAVIAKTAAEYEKRRQNFINEIDIVTADVSTGPKFFTVGASPSLASQVDAGVTQAPIITRKAFIQELDDKAVDKKWSSYFEVKAEVSTGTTPAKATALWSYSSSGESQGNSSGQSRENGTA